MSTSSRTAFTPSRTRVSTSRFTACSNSFFGVKKYASSLLNPQLTRRYQRIKDREEEREKARWVPLQKLLFAQLLDASNKIL